MSNRELSDATKKVMSDFGVDEKTAGRILSDRAVYAQERMAKWVNNMRKIQKEKAEEIYALTKRLKREGVVGNGTVINDIEKKLLAMCVETYEA